MPGPWVGWRTCAFASALYVAFLAISAPATLFAWSVTAATKGIALLEQPRGSFWHGDAAALVVTDEWQRAHRYGQPSWEFFFLRVLAGELQAIVVIDDQHVRGRAFVNYQLDGFVIKEASVEMPAEKLAAHLPALAPARLSGLVSLRTNGFLVGRDALAGKAMITWRRASTELSALTPLGDYAAQISAAGKRLEVSLDTTRGPLRMQGHGYWSAQDGLTFSGTASGPPDREGELEAFLRLLGPRTGSAHQIQVGVAPPTAR
jgi:general secretion pathway protein N